MRLFRIVAACVVALGTVANAQADNAETFKYEVGPGGRLGESGTFRGADAWTSPTLLACVRS